MMTDVPDVDAIRLAILTGDPTEEQLLAGYTEAFRVLDQQLLEACIQAEGPELARQRLEDLGLLHQCLNSVLASQEPVAPVFVDVLQRGMRAYPVAFQQSCVAELVEPLLQRKRKTPLGGVGPIAATFPARLARARQFLSSAVLANPYIGDCLAKLLHRGADVDETLIAFKLLFEELNFPLAKWKESLKAVSKGYETLDNYLIPHLERAEFSECVLAGAGAGDELVLKAALSKDTAFCYDFLQSLDGSDFHRAMTDTLMSYVLGAKWFTLDAYQALIAKPGFLEGHRALVNRIVADPVLLYRARKNPELVANRNLYGGHLLTYAFARDSGVHLYVAPAIVLAGSSADLLADFRVADQAAGLLSSIYTDMQASMGRYIANQLDEIGVVVDQLQGTVLVGVEGMAKQDALGVLAVQRVVEGSFMKLHEFGVGDLNQNEFELPLCQLVESRKRNLDNINLKVCSAMTLDVAPEIKEKVFRSSDNYLAGAFKLGWIDGSEISALPEESQSRLMASVFDL
ncbi:hypothetical protein HNP46_000492 [Pseudomonas nitritireducens]|uniref:Uncharacterized protein n=1 Tax=Pseudomonas nitroreducens TaxID=46680 RepID=A0A7W7NYQ3_PSENT|nr:hypothetical protein [Pseudomonas nitritireducens]MBB4861681.1 hypothetical protein [Pseudomonas nitritireducens]